MADLAIQMAGHVTVPIYPTLTADTVSYILEHSESKLLFIGKLDEHPWNEMKHGVPKELSTISFPLSPAEEHDGGSHQKWSDVVGSQAKPLDPIVQRKPQEMATIIYTSGSTGVYSVLICDCVCSGVLLCVCDVVVLVLCHWFWIPVVIGRRRHWPSCYFGHSSLIGTHLHTSFILCRYGIYNVLAIAYCW